MIVEAKYTGPMAKVIIPGTTKKVARRGETVPIRVSGCVVLGGCWEITKGQKEYAAHLELIEKEKAERIAAKKARREKAAEAAEKKLAGARSAKKAVTETKGKKEATK